MLQSDFNDFIKGVSAKVHEIIDETKNLVPAFSTTGLFQHIQTDSLIHRTQGVTGFNYLEKFDENGKIKEDKTYPAYQTEYVMEDYGKIVNVSQKLMKTRESDLAAKLDEVKQLKTSQVRSLDKHAFQILVDGFSASNSKASLPISRLGDGKAMFATDHNSKVSGVSARSNRLASDPVYSETNQFTAIKMIEEQLNGRGLPIGYMGNYTIVVPPALRKLALEVNQSELRSDTANNDMNVFKGGTQVVSSVYLGAASGGSDTAWYAFANADIMNSMKYVTLIDPKIEMDKDFGTKNFKVSIDGSWAFGYSNFELGSASDGTAD